MQRNFFARVAAVACLQFACSAFATAQPVALQRPSQLDVEESSGILYIADAGTSQILTYDPASQQLSLFASGPEYYTWLRHLRLEFADFPAASATDANENVFYADPDAKSVAVGHGGIPPQVLLANLPSSPYGIAFDQARSKLYVSFPDEHSVRAYDVNYTAGAHWPALSLQRTPIS
ncbi:MAG TPA: hypothetical protein VEK34_15550 [Methylocella sp.]|nr:hypothetical protein [Methylocella sp.]